MKKIKDHPDEAHGMVFSIQRFSLQDGPGIRTTVFLKGCPLACDWCSNPESQSSYPEIMFRHHSCQACGTCADICPVQAISLENETHQFDRDACTLCMECVNACPADALQASGETMTVEAIVEEVCKDRPYYKNSDGGVTLSGGEPLFQADVALQLLKRCKEEGLQTALDTCGHVSWDALNRALEVTDIVLFDLKHLNTERHFQATGVGNERILGNLRKTVEANKALVWIRIPVIENFNDSPEYFHQLASYLKDMPVEKVSLLAYHEYGKAKYTALGREYPQDKEGSMDKERLEPLKEILEAAGLTVTVDH